MLMRDFFAFRTMITPFVIQVIFVIGLILVVIGGIGALANDQPIIGLALLIFGGLYWRILCELLIVVFRMNKSLDAIKEDTAALAFALPGPGGAPHPGSSRVEASPIASPAQRVSTGKSDEPAAAASAAHAAPTATLLPEGWYSDSERPGHKRWWDGTAWGIRDDEHPSTATAIAAEPSSEAEPAAVSSSEPESASAPLSQARFCENCGAERSPEARFCTSCGHA
jgi:hypothetical protein